MVPLFQTLVSGLALATSVVALNDSLVDSQILTNPYQYDFPRLGAPGAKLFPMRRCHGFKLEEATIDQIQGRLENGTFTSVELLECYLDRIHQTQPYLKYVQKYTHTSTVSY
jgi:amidase